MILVSMKNEVKSRRTISVVQYQTVYIYKVIKLREELFVVYLEKLVDFAQIKSLFVVKLVDVNFSVVQKKQTKAHDLQKKVHLLFKYDFSL